MGRWLVGRCFRKPPIPFLALLVISVENNTPMIQSKVESIERFVCQLYQPERPAYQL